MAVTSASNAVRANEPGRNMTSRSVAVRTPQSAGQGQAESANDLEGPALLRSGALRRAALRLHAGRVGLQTIAMQVGAVHVKPGLGALHVGADAAQHAPEPRRMV